MKTAPRLILCLVVLSAGCRSVPVVRYGMLEAEQDPVAGSDPAGWQRDPPEPPAAGVAPKSAPAAEPAGIKDPLEPVNRAFFQFNDKLYFWVLKPVAKGYTKVVPEPARRGVKNFFSNITTPVRLVNCLLQAEFEGAWVELERLAINTTVGVAGFGDPAKSKWNLAKRNEDLGQTLGAYGLGPSAYIVWPFLGPSSVRDTVGYVGDLFLDPINYLVPYLDYNLGLKSYDTVNTTSLQQGEYEDLKNSALDPYVALRDAYGQYRKHLVESAGSEPGHLSSPVPRD